MEYVDLIRMLAAFAFVLSLMWILSLIMKRVGYGKLMPLRAEDRRLSVVEYLPLDSKNRLILVKCDSKEHLLVVNAEGTTVVETGMKAKTHLKAVKSKKKDAA